MVRQVPTLFFEVVPRSSKLSSRPERIPQFASPYPEKALGDVTRHSRSTLFVPGSLFLPLPQFGQCAKSHPFSRLPPLVLSCLSFSTSLLLESVTCSLFFANAGGGVGFSAQRAPQTRRVRTFLTPAEHLLWSQTGSGDAQVIGSSAQRRRRLHIQLSLLQAQGFQVNG